MSPHLPMGAQKLYMLGIVFVCECFGFSTASAHKYLTVPSYKILDGLVTESAINIVSVVACLSRCSSTENCKCASWNMDTFECLLSGTPISGFLTERAETLLPWSSYDFMQPDETGDEIGDGTDDEIGNEIVWHKNGPNGRYSMTFEEAGLLCAEAGARMATRAEVIYARSQGYEKCSCSWMVDGDSGIIGFILQAPNSLCHPNYNTEIIVCGALSKGEVFCFGSEPVI